MGKLIRIFVSVVNCFNMGNILKFSQLDRLVGAEVEDFNCQVALEVNNEELTGPGDCCNVKVVELYAPDTFDFLQGFP